MASTSQRNDESSSQPKGRSSSGCWTCRVRRKKCDETPGKCSLCSSLNLKCDGYGLKPEWMDGGIREKHKLEELKRRVRRHRKRSMSVSKLPSEIRRHSWSPRSFLGDVTSIIRPETHAGLTPNQFSTTVGAGPSTQATSSNAFGDGAVLNGTIHADSLRAVLNYNISNPFPPVRGTSSVPIGVSTGAGSPKPGTSALDAEREAEGQRLLAGEPLRVCQDANSHFATDALDAHDLGDKQPRELSVNESQNTHLDPLDLSPFPWSDFVCLEGGDETASTEVPQVAQNTKRDSAALEFFTNIVLPNQFPLADRQFLSHLQQRILFPQELIRVYIHNTVAAYVRQLKAYGLQKFGLTPSKSVSCESPNKAGMEMIEDLLCASLDPSDRTIRRLALEEIAIVLTQQLLLQIEESPETQDALHDLAKLMAQTTPSLRAESSLLELLYDLSIVQDVVGSATFGTPLQTWSLPASTVLVNESLVQITGCQPWVFEKMLDITNLRAWKLSALAAGNLNVIELADKSSAIRRSIQQSIDENGGKKTWSTGSMKITAVYAHAAEVYLSTTTSGAYPKVSDIRGAVSRTVSAIECLDCPRLLRNISWPICVAAAMACEEHESFFSGIEHGARCGDEYGLKLSRAFIVARECQRLRKNSPALDHGQERCTYDWIDAMRSLGKEWSLL